MVFVRSKLDRRFARFCRTGDPEALAFVFDRAAARLLRVALWLCRHRADAEDAVQRTFLQAIALRERGTDVRRALPWLLGLLAHQVHRLRRERQRQRREASVPMPDQVVDPQVEATARELQEAVRAVRARMPEPYRDVLQLHLESGLDAGEIAARLGRPAGTVRTQLVRALELLRRKLPSGFVAGFAPLAFGGGEPLQGMRLQVIATARSGAAGCTATAAGIGGLLMANKLLVAVPLLLLGAGLGVYVLGLPSPPHADMAAAPPSPAAAAPASAIPVVDTERVVTASPPPAPAAQPRFDPAPPAVTAWVARFLAVDADQRPVADARITVWKAKRHLVHREPGGPQVPAGTYNYSGHLREILFELHTDSGGRAECTCEVECIAAAARKPDVGLTGWLLLRNQQASDGELKFVLEAPVVVRGQVLGADGAPAAGARVVVDGSGWSILQHGRPEEVDPVTADVEGRFAITLQRGTAQNLHAELHGDRTDFVWLSGLVRDTEVVLRFPGGIRLTGIVVDAAGAPIGGASVGAWREYHPDDPQQVAQDWETAAAEADADGRFAIDVRHHARYQLIASAAGFANSPAVWVEPTPARPIAVATLRLQQTRPVAGVVLREDGSLFAGARVEATAERGLQVMYTTVPNRRDEFGEPQPLQVGDDGRFTFALHPQTSWRLTALVAGGMRVVQTGIAPGDTAVVLRFTAADLAGCVVHGSVRRSDGQPLGDWRVFADYLDEGYRKELAVHVDGASFTTPALPLGLRMVLRVQPFDATRAWAAFANGLAPALSAPFVTSPEPTALEFVLQPSGRLPVRVVTAAGEVAHRVRVSEARSDMRFAEVDADGRVLLERCLPGAGQIMVRRDSEVILRQDVTIHPGSNPELTVRLPAQWQSAR